MILTLSTVTSCNGAPSLLCAVALALYGGSFFSVPGTQQGATLGVHTGRPSSSASKPARQVCECCRNVVAPKEVK